MSKSMPSSDRPIYTPPSGPPQVERPSPAIFEHMKEEGIFKMCEAFYARLGASDIAPLFPDDLVEASRRQALFLIGLLGGPPLYQQQIGQPRMRARHLPFVIDEAARQTWVRCLRETLEEPEKYGFPTEHADGFWAFIEGFSRWMVNKGPCPSSE